MRKSCCEKQHNRKGSWTRQEDQKLLDFIKIHGEGCWSTLPNAAGLQRSGKSCRLRWMNYLRPDIKRDNFGLDEEDLIIKLHALLGNRWPLIAGRLPGRTDHEVKNYWNSHIKRKLISVGIDPNNHHLNQKLPPSSTTNIIKDAKSLSVNSNSRSFSKSHANGLSLDSASFNNNNNNKDDDAVSSTHLNLNLPIAFPPPPS